jgi:hypothetical protein
MYYQNANPTILFLFSKLTIPFDLDLDITEQLGNIMLGLLFCATRLMPNTIKIN